MRGSLALALALFAGCDDAEPSTPRMEVWASDAAGSVDGMVVDAAVAPRPVDATLPVDVGPPADASPMDAQPADAARPVDAAPPRDACVPEDVCPARACGPRADGCGAQLRCGGCPAAGEICAEGVCVPEGEELLLERPGPFFSVDGLGASHTIRLEPGPAYARVTVDVYATHGGWREDVFDREVLSHNLWGLSRIAERSVERYLLGVGAQIRPADAGLRRRALYYARVDLEQRPAGEGWMGYTSFREDFPWEPGVTYRTRAVLDAAGAEQRLEILVDDVVVARIGGAIDYMRPALTTSGFTLDFAGDETDHRDVRPVGWIFSDLRVTAQRR